MHRRFDPRLEDAIKAEGEGQRHDEADLHRHAIIGKGRQQHDHRAHPAEQHEERRRIDRQVHDRRQIEGVHAAPIAVAAPITAR